MMLNATPAANRVLGSAALDADVFEHPIVELGHSMSSTLDVVPFVNRPQGGTAKAHRVWPLGSS